MDNKINNSYYECKRCFHRFYQKNDMKKHLDKKNICIRMLESYNYNSEDLYYLSLQRIKYNKKTHICQHCNKHFSTNHNLNRHIEKSCNISNEIIDIIENINSSKNNKINIIKSFDDDWDISNIDLNQKLVLLLTKSNYIKTLENILENEVNLNVLIDNDTSNCIVFNNNQYINITINDIIKQIIIKLNKYLIEFHANVTNPNIFDIDNDYLDYKLKDINNEFDKFQKDQNLIKDSIIDIYNKKKNKTIYNYIA
jgi:hypothetical protein